MRVDRPQHHMPFQLRQARAEDAAAIAHVKDTRLASGKHTNLITSQK